MRKTTTRKSFIIHKDSLDILKDLTDEQAGQLFKAINHYQNGNDFELSQILKIAFNPFKNQFVRDDEYPGKRKKGNETEFTNFIKKHSDWKDVLPLLEKHSLVFDVSDEKYIPSLSKWINNRDWEIESESSSNNTPYWGNNAI
jgi:hypothetical protein